MVDGTSKSVAVVGGGISGLAAAWELVRHGYDVTVLESSPRIGGVIQTTRRGHYTFESGPHAIRSTSREVPQFLEEVGLWDEAIAASRDGETRHLYFHGRLQALPSSVREFLNTDLLTWSQKLRVLMERWVKRGAPDHEETVAEFFGRRLGRGITMTWIDIVVAGIFAGNPNRLGISSAFPELKQMEDDYGSLFKAMRCRAKARHEDASLRPTLISFKEGLEHLPRRLGEKLAGHIRVNSEVVRVSHKDDGSFVLHVRAPDGSMSSSSFEKVILTAPADATGILLAPFVSEVADLLFEIEHANVVVAHAGFEEDALPGLPNAYGFLVPRHMRMRTVGWTFNSQIFPEQNPEGRVSMTGAFGGCLDPHCVDLSDEQTIHLMMGELALALGLTRSPRPDVFASVRWQRVLPQLNVGHMRRMQAVQSLIDGRAPGLIVAGSWVDGPSIDKCIACGRRAAREVIGAQGEVAA